MVTSKRYNSNRTTQTCVYVACVFGRENRTAYTTDPRICTTQKSLRTVFMGMRRQELYTSNLTRNQLLCSSGIKGGETSFIARWDAVCPLTYEDAIHTRCQLLIIFSRFSLKFGLSENIHHHVHFVHTHRKMPCMKSSMWNSHKSHSWRV